MSAARALGDREQKKMGRGRGESFGYTFADLAREPAELFGSLATKAA